MNDIYFRGHTSSDDSHRVCVVFDQTSGRVIHIHGATTLDKTRALSEPEFAERALLNAKRFGHKIDSANTLHVKFSEIRRPGIYHVENSKLVLKKAMSVVREQIVRHAKKQTSAGGGKHG